MNQRLLGAVFLVAGVAIGAGMLGMPIITGFAGFYPSLLVMVCCWLFSLFSALLIVDVNLSLNGEVNFMSAAEQTLGKGGKIFSWVIYLFLLYSLDVAFIAAGGKILGDLFPSIPSDLFPLMISVPLGMIVFRGVHTVDRVNRFLVVGKLFFGYGILVCFVPAHVKTSLLEHVNFSPLLFTLPVVLQAFGFHAIVPSLVNYLKKDAIQLRWALTLGSLIALVVYAVWEMLVLGVVPVTGEISLTQAYVNGDVSTTPLMHIVQKPLIATGAITFALFGVATAFLGVTLGLFDCLVDGFKIKSDLRGKCIASILTFLPPLIFVYTSPSIFLEALEYAGAFVAIISGIVPICMARKIPAPSFWQTVQGKIILMIGLMFFLIVILFDIFSKMGFLSDLIK